MKDFPIICYILSGICFIWWFISIIKEKIMSNNNGKNWVHYTGLVFGIIVVSVIVVTFLITFLNIKL